MRDAALEPNSDEMWQSMKPSDEPLRHRWFFPAIGVTLAVSVPFYLPTRFSEQLYAGLPLWAWITLFSSAALAALTAYGAARLWRDDGPGEG